MLDTSFIGFDALSVRIMGRKLPNNLSGHSGKVKEGRKRPRGEIRHLLLPEPRQLVFMEEKEITSFQTLINSVKHRIFMVELLFITLNTAS